MLWHRTNSWVLITKFLKVPRIVNAITLRKFKNLFSWFEIEISSFSSFFPLFSLSSFFHLHFWLSVIIRTTLWQDYINNPSNINKIRPIETKGAGGLQPHTPHPPPSFLLLCIFHELKKIVLKWKTPQRLLIFLTLLLTSTPEMVSCQ